jgi:hypothetical protein
VQCAAHGETLPTFACVHLATASAAGRGVAYDATSLDPWPDIVCRACDDEPPLSEAQANERTKVICGYCWDDAFGANAGHRHPDPDGWLEDAAARAQRRQRRWTTEFRILEKRRYRYQLEESPPWLGFGETDSRFDVLCDPVVIGSFSNRSNTWLWGWANGWWPASLTRTIVAAKRAGEKLGIERLWRSRFEGDEALAWRVSLAALDLLPDLGGVYRSPSETGSLFLGARNTRQTD